MAWATTVAEQHGARPGLPLWKTTVLIIQVVETRTGGGLKFAENKTKGTKKGNSSRLYYSFERISSGRIPMGVMFRGAHKPLSKK
jgi:hypothetical protein